MNNIEYFTCECVYHKYGYVLCSTCAVILEAPKRSVFVKRWRNRRKSRDNNTQSDLNDFNPPVSKHDN